MCPRCNRPLGKNLFKSRCVKCLAQNRAEYRAKRARNVAAGRCECGHESAPGRQSCVQCLARATRNRTRAKRLAEYQRTKYLQRKASGVCIACGKNSVDNGSVKCRICRRQHAALERKRYYER
jgi:hypothetical protein